MPDPEAGTEAPGLLDHLRRAIGHAMEGFRYYAALLAADAEHRFDRTMRSAVWSLAGVALGVVGAVFLALGVAEFLDGLIGGKVPGAGRILVGGGILAVLAAVLLLHRKRGSPA